MRTEVIQVDPDGFEPEELDHPARVLAEGGLVAFPTETVYGIGANAHLPEAVHRLSELKSRPEGKPYSLHVADRDQVGELVEEVPALARSLMDFYWPGPLTIVFPGNAGSGVGVRLPSHPVARELIRRSGVPIVAPSANRSGEEPAVDATGVLAAFEGKIPLIVDGGRVAIRQASTVVRIEGESFQMLREGIITEEMIRKALRGKRILFVCTGNSCRSPMAEGLLKSILAEEQGGPVDELPDQGYRISSAGIAAFGGGRASENAVIAMKERGIDIEGHRSRGVTQELVSEADLIITLGPSHRWQLVQWNPEVSERVQVITELGIFDPIGGTLETYRRCADEIEKELREHWIRKVMEL